MTRVRYGLLSAEDKALLPLVGIVNGCGPKYRLVNWLVPDVLFGMQITEYCNQHDFNYWLGGGSKKIFCNSERLKADRQLREAIWARAKETRKACLLPILYIVSWIYYAAVRVGGAYGDLWHNGPERTLEDLDEAIGHLRPGDPTQGSFCPS